MRGASDLTDPSGPSTSDPTAALIGTSVDHYRIESIVGYGAMGVVYRARHQLLGMPVALKALGSTLFDPTAPQRFLREAQIASSISHRNIIQIHHFGLLPDGRPYLAMELLAGTTLEDVVRKGPLSVRRACYIARQVALGLHEVHKKGIVHRDLKPANVHLGDAGAGNEAEGDAVKILDFGIAKVMLGERSSLRDAEDPDAQELTGTGVILGTPLYMSPEQASGETLDARTDVFSLGCILFEMLTGDLPYPIAEPAQVILQRVTLAPRRPRELRPDIPESLEQLVLRSLAPKRAERFADMASLAEALQVELERLSSGSNSAISLPPGKLPAVRAVPRPAAPRGHAAHPSKASGRRLSWAAGGLGVVLGGLLLVLLQPRSEPVAVALPPPQQHPAPPAPAPKLAAVPHMNDMKDNKDEGVAVSPPRSKQRLPPLRAHRPAGLAAHPAKGPAKAAPVVVPETGPRVRVFLQNGMLVNVRVSCRPPQAERTLTSRSATLLDLDPGGACEASAAGYATSSYAYRDLPRAPGSPRVLITLKPL